MRLSPGCCHCIPAPSCQVFDDDFDRANSTNLGADWTEVDGDWEIDTNNLVLDNDTGLCLCDEAHPDSEARQIVSVDIKCEDDGDAVGIVLDYDDSTHYHYVEVTVNTPAAPEDPPAGTIKFFKKDGAGAATQVGATVDEVDAEPGGWYALKACFSGTSVACEFDGKVYSRSTTEHGGDQVGVLVTTCAAAGTLRFDDFDFDKYYSATNPACEACYSCTGCVGGLTPTLVKAVFASIADDSCNQCDEDVNGTFFFELDPDLFGGGSPSYCYWGLPFTGASDCACVDQEAFIKAYDDGSVDVFICAGQSGFDFGEIWYESSSTGSPVDCMSWNNTSIPWSKDDGTFSACDGSSSTCHLTAL